MSVDVVLYQIAIFLLIIAGSLLIGGKGIWLTAVVAALFTIFNVSTAWLMILQFGTILLSAVCGALICSKENYKDIRKQSWGWVLLATGATYWYVYNEKPSNPTIQETSAPKGAAMALSPSPTTNATGVANQSRDHLVQGASGRRIEEERMLSVISRLERRYPELDEKSSRYNDQLTETVLARQLLYIRQGILPPEALDRAANEVMSARAAAVRPSQPKLSVACRRSDGSFVAEPCKENEERVIQNLTAVKVR